MKKVAFIDGIVLDFFQKSQQQLNILLANGKVVGLGYLPDEDQEISQIIQISKLLIVPNILDMCVQVGDPFSSENETFESISTAAITAGISAILGTSQMAIDTPEEILAIRQESHRYKLPMYLLGAITQKRAGQLLSEMGLLKENGVIAFSDGCYIKDESIMKKALQYSAMLKVPLIIGPTDMSGYDMQEGYYSTVLGLKGISPIQESNAIYRDIAFVKQYGGQVHFSHVSTAESVALIRSAKQQGLPVTCGTAPHYLYLTEADVEGYNTATKINPPLRTSKDVDGLIAGLKDGTIDVLASHHTPILMDHKRTDYHSASFGMSGIDLFLPLILTKLYHEHAMSLLDVFAKITINPLKILNLKPPSISFGLSPSFTVIDLNEERTISVDFLRSKGHNTPFIGKSLKGIAKYTVIRGELII